MKAPLTETKILISDLISSHNETWEKLLLAGDFYGFEKSLKATLMRVSDEISKELIHLVSTSEAFYARQGCLAKKKGLGKLVKRPATIQLQTGTKVSYGSLYAKRVPENYEEHSRHLSHLYWGIVKGSSPLYSSLMCLLSTICPSFAMAKNILGYLNVKTHFNRVRDVSLGLAARCMQERAGSQLEKGETLAGQRVLIGIDGGRTRTRQAKSGQEQASKYEDKRKHSYDTPWREPKMFVISCLDERGKVNKRRLPIYDSSFGDEQTISLLASYLQRLQVNEASSVQIVGDGAAWIWNKMKPMLLKLGVAEEKITETLDHYHAMEHLHAFKQYFPAQHQQDAFEQLTYHLWRGNIRGMKKVIKRFIPDIDLDRFTAWQYFEKHKKRIDYQGFKKNAMPCGSGIIESGIRRIINLRFKSPSGFWYPQNVEKLILMRSIALSGRWEIMMENITNQRL